MIDIYTIKAGEYINQDENITIFKYFTSEAEPEHAHEFLEIVYVSSGKGRQVINGSCFEVERGDLLFINFGQAHSFTSEEPMEIVNCLVNPEFIDRELNHSENAFELLALSYFEEFEGKFDRLIPVLHFRGKELLELEALLGNILQEFHEKNVNYRTALRGYLLVLLTKIFREMQQKELGKILTQMNKLTPDLLQYIEDNCFEKISLQELARKCFYNPSYFSKIFKDFYGKNLMDFIHEKRITEALRLLKETGLSIEQISQRVGYTDRKQFYKLFKEHMGIPPSTVRSTLQKKTP